MTDQSTLANPFHAIPEDRFSEDYQAPVEETENEEPEEVEATAETEIEEQTDEPETTEDDIEESEVEAEAESEDDADEEAEPEEEGEEGETESSRTIKYKWYGEEEEFDPFEDEAETARLLQMGKKFEKQHGITDLIDKGIVKYDLNEGGLVPGTAFQEAEVRGARTLVQHLVKAGVMEEGDGGQPVLSSKVLAAISQQQAPDTFADDTKLQQLEEAFYADQTAENWKAWQEEKIRLDIERKFQTRDSAAEQKRKQQAEEQELRQRIELAKSNIKAKANELKGLYKNPDGSFDEETWQYDLETAQALMLSRDDRGQYQYDRAMKGLERAAQLHAKRTTQTVKAKTTRRKPAKKATRTPTSRPATGKTQRKESQETTYDPSNPFGHIPIPE